MANLLIWILLWAIIWTFFNLFIKWYYKKSSGSQYILNSIFFLISSTIVYFVFKNYFSAVNHLIYAALICILLAIILGSIPKFYSKIKKGRYFLVTKSVDIFMQQLFVLSAVAILTQIYKSGYHDYYFGIIFMSVHFPIIFLKWSKFRYLFLFLTLIGGAVFSYLIRNYYAGMFLSYLLHFAAYIPVIYFLKNEDFI